MHSVVALVLALSQSSIFDFTQQKDQIYEIQIVQTPEKRKQIVQTDKVEKSQTAADDALLSEQTQQVVRQTKAARVDRFRQLKTAQGAKAGQKQKMTLGTIGVAVNMKPLGHLGPEGLAQEAATNDNLKEVKEGAQTLLNTREFAYYSFYQRVRTQLEQFWEPGLRERVVKMFRRGRQLASEKEMSTRLLVVLNTNGVITKILVNETSGVFDLDQAAVDAFNKAGPFPNPPTGMVEPDGTVKVEWEFVLRT